MFKKISIVAAQFVLFINVLLAGCFWGFDSGAVISEEACVREFHFSDVGGPTIYSTFYGYYTFLIFSLLILVAAKYIKKEIWPQMIVILFSVISLAEYLRLYNEKVSYLEFLSQKVSTEHILKYSALARETIQTDIICSLVLLLIIGFEIFLLIQLIKRRKQLNLF